MWTHLPQSANLLSRLHITAQSRWRSRRQPNGPTLPSAMINIVGTTQTAPFVAVPILYSRIEQHYCEARFVVYRRVMRALPGLCGAFDYLTK